MDKINFYIPDFWSKYKLNFNLINLLRQDTTIFYENIDIGAIYGTFPNCIWNGGRSIIGGDPGIHNIESTIEGLNMINIPVRFTWTNNQLTEEHLNDRICNYIMDCANNGMNEVIINSSILEDYLREKYPNFKYISSTTKCLLDNEEIINESKKYYLTVLDYRKNMDLDFLQSLENKEKYEILINPYCNPQCKRRADHYTLLSKQQIGEPIEEPYCETFDYNFYDILKYPTVVKIEDLYSKYYAMGYTNFKIEGRTNSVYDVLENYIYYMVKPEFQNQMRLKMLNLLT